MNKIIILRIIILFFIIILIQLSVKAQQEVIVRPSKPITKTLPNETSKSKNNFIIKFWNNITGKNKELTPEEKIQLQYQLAIQRHLSLQDERTRQRILHDIKMTNYYYDKQKESNFVKWIKYQKFKLKRKKII